MFEFAKFRPSQDRVLVKRKEQEEEERTAGGIVIPSTAKEKPQEGTVLEVGPGRLTPEGVILKVQVKKGDTVFFGKYAGTEVDNGLLVLREDEILGTIEK